MSMNREHPSFSEWLWAQIVSRDWSQVDLAEHANLTKQAVNNYLNQDRIPKKDAMEKLAHALKLPVETLYRAAGILPTPEEWSPSQSEWDAIFGELSEADRDEMLAIARMKLDRKRGAVGGKLAEGKI